MSRRVWLLNFDSDDELGAHGTSGTTSSGDMRARLAKLAPLVGALTGDDAIASEARVEGAVGYAWCPTPSALRALAKIGARVPAAPSIDILRRANHRRFSAELGQTVPGAVFVEDFASAFDHLSKPSPTGSWVVKRPFSYAGRGRIFVRAERSIDEHQRWLRASFVRGPNESTGLQIEPWLPRVADYAQHGFVGAGGRVTLGDATTQICDARGVWSGSISARDLSAEEERALEGEAAKAGEALRSIGFFGPFGIDAFRYSASSASTGFCARIEVNARYTMGWGIGMAARRVDLLEECAYER